MGNWFGNLQLAYKYTIVFLSLLVLTIAAGLLKVLYNRRKMQKHVKNQNVEAAGARDDQVELNQREKDEGDLFGVRAIEAGFYAGIPQSRPTSRAGSYIDSPSMSTSTLVGGLQSPKVATHSMTSSVTTLPMAHTASTNRDSDTLPSSNSPPRNKRAPPTIKLRPSEAEMSGRLNHNAAVNMSLHVPPSPVLARGPQSPIFGGSDSGESDGDATPRSLSPRSANFRPDHYAPSAPQIPLPEGLRAGVHSPDITIKSQSASVNDPSPHPSAPPSPAPQTKLPSMPRHNEPRSLFPATSAGPESKPRSEAPHLLPQTYQPSHKRDMSDASSIYSQNRVSIHQHKASSSSEISYNYSLPGNSDRNSAALNPSSSEQSRRPSASSSLLAPDSATSKDGDKNDPRFSEFYDAYYRHSQLVQSKGETARRPGQIDLSHATIVEVPSPLPSPNPSTSLMQPGMAM